MKLFGTKKPEYKWPDCAPPADGESPGGWNINGTFYKKVEVSPGKWQMAIDAEMEKYAHDREQRRRDLYWALRSRALTDAEMAQVAQYGQWLNIEPNVQYFAEQKAKELNDALLQQFRLRAVAQSAPQP